MTATTILTGSALSINVTVPSGYVGDMINLTVQSPPSSSYNIWGARDASGSLGHWSGNGRLIIESGGLDVSGALVLRPVSTASRPPSLPHVPVLLV